MRLPSEPVRNTCPDIDKLQKTIKEIRNNFLSFKDTDDIVDFLSCMEDSSWELKYISDTLEDLRNSNSSLRDWGYELTSLAEQMESEHQTEMGELSDIISAKESEIESLEETIEELKLVINDK